MRKDEERIYHSPNIVNLCIDSYDIEKQCGRLYHQYRENPLPFSSLFEAFKRMDELYDDLRYPESTTQTRSFLEKPRESGSRRLREERMKDFLIGLLNKKPLIFPLILALFLWILKLLE